MAGDLGAFPFVKSRRLGLGGFEVIGLECIRSSRRGARLAAGKIKVIGWTDRAFHLPSFMCPPSPIMAGDRPIDRSIDSRVPRPKAKRLARLAAAASRLADSGKDIRARYSLILHLRRGATGSRFRGFSFSPQARPERGGSRAIFSRLIGR